MAQIEIPLVDQAGNPMAFRRIAESHGLAGVAPWQRTGPNGLDVTVNTGSGARTLSFRAEAPDAPGQTITVSWNGKLSDLGGGPAATALARKMLGLERDLSGFLSLADADPNLDWAREVGAGAMARGATAFEDVIRTILTTNCSWGLTVKMCQLLVAHAGEAEPGPEKGSHIGRAFPGAAAMAGMSQVEFQEKVRVGYRAGRLRGLSTDVASGKTDIEGLADAHPVELPDAKLQEELLALPGVGPYAAAHIMLLLGRPAGVILDSWTRPKYARITGRSKVTDAEIRKRVNRYGPDAGLALWLILSRDWFDSPTPG